MTPDQQRRYDELKAEENKDKRQAELERKAVVKGVDTDVAMEIKEHWHTKLEQNVYVVTMGERVDREVYDELNQRAKQLGGRYSRSFKGSPAGFQFYDRETAEKFVALKEGDQSKAEAAVERKEEKKNTAAERLIELADKLEGIGKESLNADRQGKHPPAGRYGAEGRGSGAEEYRLCQDHAQPRSGNAGGQGQAP